MLRKQSLRESILLFILYRGLREESNHAEVEAELGQDAGLRCFMPACIVSPSVWLAWQYRTLRGAGTYEVAAAGSKHCTLPRRCHGKKENDFTFKTNWVENCDFKQTDPNQHANWVSASWISVFVISPSFHPCPPHQSIPLSRHARCHALYPGGPRSNPHTDLQHCLHPFSTWK